MKNKWVQVRVSEEEKNQMLEQSRKYGLDTISSYLRFLHRKNITAK